MLDRLLTMAEILRGIRGWRRAISVDALPPGVYRGKVQYVQVYVDDKGEPSITHIRIILHDAKPKEKANAKKR